MSLRRRRVLVLAVALGAYAACTGPPASEAQPGVDTDGAASSTGSPIADSRDQRVGCIRSGFTPAEVRAALGEPDSIAGGWWVYGRTQVFFSYGTVQDWMDGDSVVVC